jgi:hypothetical protein
VPEYSVRHHPHSPIVLPEILPAQIIQANRKVKEGRRLHFYFDRPFIRQNGHVHIAQLPIPDTDTAEIRVISLMREYLVKARHTCKLVIVGGIPGALLVIVLARTRIRIFQYSFFSEAIRSVREPVLFQPFFRFRNIAENRRFLSYGESCLPPSVYPLPAEPLESLLI